MLTAKQARGISKGKDEAIEDEFENIEKFLAEDIIEVGKRGRRSITYTLDIPDEKWLVKGVEKKLKRLGYKTRLSKNLINGAWLLEIRW